MSCPSFWAPLPMTPRAWAAHPRVPAKLAREEVRIVVQSLPMPRDVLPSAEARSRLPALIEEIAAHPEVIVELGRHRRREVVLVSAERYDEMLEREQLVRDVAWAAFAQERVEHPTSAPISWEDAQHRRERA
jgi:PHD/YefM family antitoxin component YafN of YafNO toxin-antitoxin module